MEKTLTKHHKERYGAWAGNRNGYAAKPDQCAEEVYRDGMYGQCARKCGHGPDGAYCKQHDPEQVAKRAAERQAKWDAKWHKQKEELNERELGRKALELVRQIAAGHNDPRGAAIELLGVQTNP